MKECLSKRGQSLSKDIPILQHAHYSIIKDLYDHQANPNGYINMGTAETHLINDEVIKLLNKAQSSLQLRPEHIHYDFFHGSEEFRSAIANHWQTVIFGENNARRITQDNIVVGAGCTLALEMLATMLGDPGDVFLVPAPYYSSFEDDINARAMVDPVVVHCGSDLDRAAFEDVLSLQKQKGKNVKAVLLSSPNNPVGTVYSKETLQGLISFCMDHNLDLISDEIYAQTIHDPEVEWRSMLKLVPDEYLQRVHVTSSFAKDFALSGFRTGFAFSYNADLLKGLQGLAYFSAVSTHTQALLTELLKSPELSILIKTNKDKLHQAYTLMKNTLDDIGVKSLPAQGGIFLFADFSKHLREQEFREEYTLWRKLFDELKINISPGQLFKAEKPGWFRICYAHDPKIVEEACRRIKKL